MFEVGFTELLLISALALLVLGPQKLPKLAQQIGRWMGRARAMARQFREQLEEEAHSLETKMSVDPGIDTSLEPRKPASPAPDAAAAGSPPDPYSAPPGAPPPPAMPPYTNDVEEEFYPPDHHMHSSNRAPAEPDAGSGTQAELDLTTTPADKPRDPQ
jgi:sec-independent protein translocase protein TatB